MEAKEKSLKEFRKIPGVGKMVAIDLYDLGYRSVSDLKGQDPELMFYSSQRFPRTGSGCLYALHLSLCGILCRDHWGCSESGKIKVVELDG